MSWDDPHAWRNGYDEWKLRSPYDDEPDSDEEPFFETPWDEARRLRDEAPAPRRWALIHEAQERSEISHAAEASRLLRRAREVLGYRRQSMTALKAAARKHIASAREARTLIGPLCPLSRIPF